MKATPIPTSSRVLVRGRDQQRCVRCGCPLQQGEWHHRRSRSVRDQHQHCPCNGVYLCTTCHAWVHGHPFLARQSGLIVSRHTAFPGGQPILTSQFGWVTLDCTGGHEFVSDPSAV